ncbi:MAG: DNA polymerase III subunit delta [Methylococcales bacterium]|nr:DNA polymerase III subunit delta [Methylococcales bacterium]
MRLKPEQLNAALQKGLASVYFLSGDEPLQLGEMADAIRKTARASGYLSREIFSVETGFSWNQLALSADSLSIFSDKKIIELRIPTSTVGTEGAKALTAYCERLPDDTLLLISIGKLASATLKSRWLESIDKVGVVIQVWALDGQDLLNWLQQRLLQRGLHVESDGIKLLASRIEGNLLAADQEITKLYVLYGAGQLSTAQISDAVADSSRYDVFKLMDWVLAAQTNRIIKILAALRAEGIAAPVILWALTREARSLIHIKLALAGGQHKDTVFRNNQIWDKRKPVVDKALTRLNLQQLNSILVLAAQADRQIKGQQSGDAWETLLAVCLLFTSLPITY